MLGFFPEIFLVLSLLSQLLFNAKLINTLKKNFPLVDKDAYLQTGFILFICLMLFLNLSGINTLTYGNLFTIVNTALILKISIIFFSLLLITSIYLSFLVQQMNFFEFFSLYLYSILSLLLIVSVDNLMSLYLIVEMQALCFYILASFLRSSAFSTEAGLKYFILSSFISGFFLFGILAIYGTLGTLNF